MKLAFSTLGCPEWEIDQIIDAARASGYDGVELRHYKGSLDLPKVLGAFPGGVNEFRRRFARAGIEICCLDSSVVLSGAESSISDGEQMIELALGLGAPYVRVFGGEVPAGEKLSRMGKRAAQRGKRVILETHDAFSVGREVAELLEAAGEEGTGALWDLHHPVKQGEPPEETARLIGDRTYHTHVKDSGSDGSYTLLGEGNVPLKDLVAELHAVGYRGYLCLEWEKAWHPELAGPEVVFPQAARYLSDLLAKLGVPRG
ncbi:MAG TPA: sugar phosphate isomerase/epimerase family protein [Armatimonadota bacterium]|nr:sugar phosphate isomerase/epimerase family protein [Armatimonadota bacterium]